MAFLQALSFPSENQDISPSEDVRKLVRQHYGEIASNNTKVVRSSCCSDSSSTDSSCCSSDNIVHLDQVVRMYETPDVTELPQEVTGISLGCGDPVTLASLLPGQVVLDLGSGGGIDCFLAARRVGEQGYVIGVDMTAEMIEKALANKDKVGAVNVDFRLGEIEHLPVADGYVDVIISNCVINLSPDKDQVFREAFRVLKPGGKLAVSDMVTDGPLPEAIKSSLSAWAGCIAGALSIEDYVSAIENAGFVDVQLERQYLDHELVDDAVDELGLGDLVEDRDETFYTTVISAKITAYKP